MDAEPTRFVTSVPTYEARGSVIYRTSGKSVDVMSRRVFRDMVAAGQRMVDAMDADERRPIPFPKRRA